MSNDSKENNNKDFSVGSKTQALHTGAHEEERIERNTQGNGEAALMQTRMINRAKAFWGVQLLGWAAYVPLRVFGGVTTTGKSMEEYFPIALTAAIIGFCLTSVLRFLYQSIRGRPMWLIGIIVLFFSAILGLGFSVIEAFIWSDTAEGIEVFGNAMFEGMVLFAWSTLYFGFHYYEDLLRQRQKALKATALAQQAQLTMLRYQLNPHFLFNTLNAISTLVLEKDSDTANKMLTKLSSFLRYTLVNKPTQKVSLEQEIYTLSLYLEIEQVRFEERLNITYDVDDEVKSALIPSLILQPHIENAIKYAVAPEENGGSVRVIAKAEGRRLQLSIEDDGPGIDDPDNPVSESSSGVGIVNTRERLAQIYGDRHTFYLQNLRPKGLRVFIDIPLERDEEN